MGPQKDAKHPAMTDTDERSGEAESDTYLRELAVERQSG
jgi:hypothetical protein